MPVSRPVDLNHVVARQVHFRPDPRFFTAMASVLAALAKDPGIYFGLHRLDPASCWRPRLVLRFVGALFCRSPPLSTHCLAEGPLMRLLEPAITAASFFLSPPAGVAGSRRKVSLWLVHFPPLAGPGAS